MLSNLSNFLAMRIWMTRFFVSAEQIQGVNAWITGEDAKHCNVLRLEPGEHVILCDGSGNDYGCVIVSVTKECAELEVYSAIPSEGEPETKYSIYCAFPKGEKAEHIVQKATELGASEINFFPSKHCVAKYDEKSADKKCERWKKIAKEAAQQSQRGIIPQVRTFTSYKSALEHGTESELIIFCYENEQGLTLASVKSGIVKSTAIVTGSEGGFSDDEAELAKALGYKIITLGKRILRCETAPLAVLSALVLGN
jgi:16S rRNA (uracil1498-N3)-methyltransferase